MKTAVPEEQRRYWRVRGAYRVDYRCGGRRAVALTANVSRGGMLVRAQDGLGPGETVDFHIHLAGAPPVTARGRVLECTPAGARIAFEPDPKLDRELVRFLVEQVVAPLERHLASRNPSVAKRIELAELYRELGRDDEGLELYRRGLASRPWDTVLREAMARYFLIHAAARRSEALLAELDSVVATGLELADSEVLRSVAERAHELHRRLGEPIPTPAPASDQPLDEAELERRELVTLRQQIEGELEAVTAARAELRRERLELEQQRAAFAAMVNVSPLRAGAP